jgi:ribonuclease BN (tRNA processing enzyme)
MTAWHFLGTGSGLLNPQRHASAYLLETNAGDVLFDCGEPVAATLGKRGYDWSRLHAIVISHTHADHLGGLPMLMQQLHLSGRTNDLSIHAPTELAERLRDHLSAFYLLPEEFRFPCSFTALKTGEAFTTCGAEVAPFPTEHLSHYRGKLAEHGYTNRCEAFAFRIRIGEQVVFYSGDVASFNDIEHEMGGSRLAVLDSTHVNVDAAIAWAKSHPETQVVLSHVSPALDIAKVEHKCRDAGVLNIRIAEEGSVLPL